MLYGERVTIQASDDSETMAVVLVRGSTCKKRSGEKGISEYEAGEEHQQLIIRVGCQRERS